jgi:hypothetical protein
LTYNRAKRYEDRWLNIALKPEIFGLILKGKVRINGWCKKPTAAFACAFKL